MDNGNIMLKMFSLQGYSMNLKFLRNWILYPEDQRSLDLNPTSVAIPYHTRSIALSLKDTQFLIPITFIPFKLGGSPLALIIKKNKNNNRFISIHT